MSKHIMTNMKQVAYLYDRSLYDTSVLNYDRTEMGLKVCDDDVLLK
jgi:hypothetical protein